MHPISTNPTSKPPAVLVVEHSQDVRLVLHRMLVHVGSRPTTAADTASAVAAVQAQPDLALVLITLGLDSPEGIATARALRSLRPDLPIVLMSGDPARALSLQPLVGARAVLSKPCSLRDLAALVAAADRSSSEPCAWSACAAAKGVCGA